MSVAMRQNRRPLLVAVVISTTVCWVVLATYINPGPALGSGPTAAPGPAPGPGPAFAPAAAGEALSLADPVAWRGFSKKEISQLSTLGRMLFLQDTANLTRRNKTFTVLIWKNGLNMENRHIFQHDPYEDCSVRNCRIEYDDKFLSKADAVIFHLHRTKSINELPRRLPEHRNQRWIFLTDESPHHTFLFDRSTNKLKNYVGVFNWSMSYRMDSDVPVPYGRAIPLTKEEAAAALATIPVSKNYALGKTGTVAVMGSNCGGWNHRWDYVRELQKHMRVDVYGGCGNDSKACPGGFTKDCPKIKNYKFYLAFENSNCRDYVTEKVWWNAGNINIKL
ncbi:Glycoprotein 3-alpha-L-fucosyltransferase A [Gryllus bimaculatus]|nr:Glycoprotein 3-alpha-L-fucosyltransferase A [Gryllus bimaculatus]